MKTGLEALRKLANRFLKSAGEQLMVGLVISKTETAGTGPKTGKELVVGGGYCW